MNIREYRPEDCEMIANLFYETINSVNSKDYTEIQLNAWASRDFDLVKWNNRLSNNYSVIVEKNNIIIGFGDVDCKGYFDHLFTHKDYQGIGVATLISDRIENYTYQNGIHIITTDASITAKPFFEKRGYIVQKNQIVEKRGQLLKNLKCKSYFKIFFISSL